MKILHVVGARPNFVKIAPIMVAMAESSQNFDQVLIHTGQHYDHQMSHVFFDDLGLPSPTKYLGIGSGSHAQQTARALVELERAVLELSPDWVVTVGDVNSTLAAALVCAKLGVNLAHVEAGLRSFDRTMPEETNRIVTDHLSDLLFCPSELAAANLRREGIGHGVRLVGDVMYDAVLRFSPRAREMPLPAPLGTLNCGDYVLATVHRAANTSESSRLRAVLDCLALAEGRVVFPVHPRTAQAIDTWRLTVPPNVQTVEPLGYLSMLRLESGARAIVTDSGGVQKEALWLAVPCVTLREETEWPETIETGWNQLVGLDPDRFRKAMLKSRPTGLPPTLYGDGHAAERIAACLSDAQ